MRYPRQSVVAGLLLFQIYGVGGLTIPTTTQPPTPVNFYERNNAFTSTSASASKTSSPPLYLPVTGSNPDPLGISQVSGFYGPGAWAAFFITGVSSWKHAFEESIDIYDANTWLFWLMINWASIDVFRTTHSINSIPAEPAEEYNAAFIKNMGPLAAAILVVFWGSSTVAAQSFLRLVTSEPQFKVDRRFWLSLGATIFPLIALTVINLGPLRQAWISNNEGAFNNFPALYYNSMKEEEHAIYLGLLLICPSSILPLALVCLLSWGTVELAAMLVQKFWFSRMAVSYLYRRFRPVLQLNVCFSVLGVLAYGAYLGSICTSNPWWLMGALPGCLVFSPMILVVLPVIWVAISFMSGGTLLFQIMIPGRKFSQSCFLMPCAPQPITDEDQMYALIGEVLLFTCLEVLVPLYKKRKEGIEWARRQAITFQLNDMLRHISTNISS